MPRHFKSSRSRAGQAIIEYCLLLAFMVVIFGSIFSVLRRGVFYFWVCDIYPRVAALHSCNDTADCYEGMENADDVKKLCPAR
jgi:hypothetical protein